MERITSLRNPKIKQIRALSQRKARDRSGLFVVEGLHHLGEAFQAGATIEYVCYAPELLTSGYGRELVASWQARGTPCYPTSADVFKTLASRERPQGILAVTHQRQASLDDLSPEDFPWGVALVNPQDPGNLGTILRTINAVGASGLILLEGGVDPFHPTAVRASMGALFWHPLAIASRARFKAWVERWNYHVYGTSARGDRDYRQVPGYERPAILLMGSERQGLDDELLRLCTWVVRLPMRGTVTSLNLAVAAGVMLYAMLDEGDGKSVAKDKD